MFGIINTQGDKDMSEAFREFIQKRCEEIKSADEKCKEANQKILFLEDKIRSQLSGSALQTFIEYENLIMDLCDHTETLLYRKGWSDSRYF
jgi:hypothetical protein